MTGGNANMMPTGSGLSHFVPETVGITQRAAFPNDVFPRGRSSVQILMDYWRILLKRRWVVLVSLAFMLVAATFISLRTTPMYRAVGQITLMENSNPLGLRDAGANNDTKNYGDATVELATEVAIFRTNSVVLQAIRKLQVAGYNQFRGESKSPSDSRTVMLTGPQIRNEQDFELVSAFKKGLNIVAIPRTRVVEVQYSSPNPHLAADAVSALINAYIEQNFRTRFQSTSQVAEWLSKQLSDLQVKVEVSEEKLVRYQKEHGIVGADEKQNIITAKLDEINKELTAAEADRIQKQAIYQLTQSGDPQTVSTITQDTFLQSLRAQQADLKNQLAQATVRLGSAYPKVVELKDRIQQLEGTIKAELESAVGRIHNDYMAAIQREDMLRRALEKQTQDANQLSENAIQYTVLKRDADSNRRLYDGLVQKLKEASISAGLSSSDIHIVDLPSPPLHPFRPNTPVNLGLGLLMGLTLGVALAFVLEVIDDTVSTIEQVEAAASLPSLAIIPIGTRVGTNDRRLLSSGIRNENEENPIDTVTYTAPTSDIAEAYRALRTSILLSSPETAPRVILVTSPLPQEGKTTTCINSAIAFAQEGRRVLLVDGDLRRPAIHKRLSLKSAAGLTTVLTGNAAPELLIIPSPQLSNLFVLPAGPATPHPAELLGSTRMKQLLSEWEDMFDHVILDLPPVLLATDAVRLSREVHAVVLVIRSGKTRRSELQRTTALLAQVNANVMGVVVNAFDLKSADYYSCNYYSPTEYVGAYSSATQENKHQLS